MTEQCEADLPLLITNVETTTATTADDAVTSTIHEALQERNLLPKLHLVDTGFVDAALILESEASYDIELFGPVRGDYKWQAREGQGFAAGDFEIDWERQQAHCPGGATSISWTPAIDKGTNEVIKIKFSVRDCQSCPLQAQCTTGNRRSITVRPQAQHLILQKRRAEQETNAFRRVYAKRAGIEGTMSQSVRTCGVRRSRYMGLAKTHLQHLATGAALNILRVTDWLSEHPRAKTRQSAFERAYRAAA